MVRRFFIIVALFAFLGATMSTVSLAASKSAFSRFMPLKGAMLGPRGKTIPLTGFVAGVLANHVAQPPAPRSKSAGPIGIAPRPFSAVTHIFGLFSANEPSLAVDPVISNHMFASANDYRLGFDSAPGLYRTFKGTTGWLDGLVQYVNSGPYYYNTAGDPAVASDIPGDEFVAMLAFNRYAISGGNPQNSVLVARTHFSIGDNFVDAVPANIETDVLGFLNDKDSFTTDNGSTGSFVSGDYVAWTRFSSSDSPIMASSSHTFGCHGCWSAPVLVSHPGGVGLCPFSFGGNPGSCSDNTASSVAIGSLGTVWIAYENFDTPHIPNQILIAKSTDGGATFGAPVRVADNLHDIFNPVGFFRVNSFPNLAVYRVTGKLYVVWADMRNGSAQILGSQSATGAGGTWSAPVVLNSDSGTNFHFFPAVSVKPGSGNVYVSFYSNENNVGKNKYDYVFRKLSATLGGTMTDEPLNSSTIDPSFGAFGGFFFGDYTASSPDQAAGIGACVAWTDDNAVVGEENIQNTCVK